MNKTLARLGLALAVAGTGVSSSAQAADRIPVPDIRPLLRSAIERGTSRGVLAGDAAAYVRQRFDTEAPIEVDVKRLHALPQPGCSRLEITTRQLGVAENGRREDKELAYQLSYCRDGTFPGKR